MKNISRTSVWIIVGLIILAVFSAGYSQLKPKQSPANEPIKIGAALGLTGDAAAWSEAAKNGVMLAVDDINDRGGVNGRKIELVIEDMQSSSKGSISAVSKLISVDHVEAIVGPSWLDSYQGASELVKDNNIVLVSPDAGIEAVNGDVVHRNVFSTWYRTDVKARLIAQYMAKHGVKKLGQLYQDDPYYTDFAERIKKYAKQYGIEIVATELVTSGVSDVRTPALKLKASGADAVIFALYDEKAVFNFLKIRQESFPTMPLFGDEFIQDHYDKPEYSGLYENTVYFRAASPNRDFEKRYVARYHTEPAFGAAPAYDATMVIAQMLRDKGLGADYNEYLHSTEFESVTYSQFTFDSIGGVETANNQFDLWKVHDNKVEKVK